MWKMAHCLLDVQEKSLLILMSAAAVFAMVLWRLYRSWEPKSDARKSSRHLGLKTKEGIANGLQNWLRKKKKAPSPDWGAAGTLQISIPLASEIRPDQQPTLVWILEVVRVASIVIANSEEGSSQSSLSTRFASGLVSRLGVLEKHLNAAIRYQRSQCGKKRTVGEREIKGIEPPEATPEAIRSFDELDREGHQILEEAEEHRYEAIPAAETFHDVELLTEPPHPLQDYDDLFRTIPLPEVAKTFQTDEYFAKMRVAGPNPMSIEGVTKSQLQLLIGDRISDADFNAVLQTTGDSVQRAGAEGRLCVVNFRSLTRTENRGRPGSTFVTNPIAIFAEPISGSDFIKPVAIQLGQAPDESELILANTQDVFRWQIAKQIVQVADFVYQTMVVHVAYVHYVMEAFSVAIQRQLGKDHPLHKLLSPHVEGTNFANQLFNNVVISDDGPIDHVTSVTDRRLQTLRDLTVETRMTFDFANRMPDVELAARKIDKLKVFPYRDDALLLWGAMQRWASDYVDLYYEDDKDVSSDRDLRNWSDDLEQNAYFVNFKGPETKPELVRVLSMIMFTASAQHAAVNFALEPYMSYAPAMSGLIWDDLPDDTPATEEQWLKMLPPLPVAQEQLTVLYFVGSVRYRRLGEYHENSFPYCGTLDLEAAAALEKFRSDLKDVEMVINESNKTRGAFSYELLLPSLVPASVNI